MYDLQCDTASGRTAIDMALVPLTLILHCVECLDVSSPCMCHSSFIFQNIATKFPLVTLAAGGQQIRMGILNRVVVCSHIRPYQLSVIATVAVIFSRQCLYFIKSPSSLVKHTILRTRHFVVCFFTYLQPFTWVFFFSDKSSCRSKSSVCAETVE